MAALVRRALTEVCTVPLLLVFRPHRSTTYVDAAYSYRPSSVVCRSVGLSVGLSVTLVSTAKTAAPIELPFGLRTWVVPGNHVLDVGPAPPMGRDNFFGENGRPIEPIGMPFGLWAGMGRRNHVLDGGP